MRGTPMICSNFCRHSVSAIITSPPYALKFKKS